MITASNLHRRDHAIAPAEFGRRIPVVAPAVAALVTALVIGIAGCAGGSAPSRTVPSSAPSGWSAVPDQVAEIPPAAPVHDYADPVELLIPSIGVRSKLERLGTDARGELKPPQEPARAGWFTGGVQPGDPGPAVIAGHVDSRTGPAVFTRLASLARGSTITVIDATGTAVTFRAELVKSYPKAEFPTQDVYGATPDPQLSLITCGGGFDRARGHYDDNVIVYAGRTG